MTGNKKDVAMVSRRIPRMMSVLEGEMGNQSRKSHHCELMCLHCLQLFNEFHRGFCMDEIDVMDWEKCFCNAEKEQFHQCNV